MKRYTAQEMRIRADYLEGALADKKTAAMLRQAADEQERLNSILDAIEKEFKKQSTCRSCEWRGKSIRSEPACPCDEDKNFSVYEIDIVDRLRQAADMMEKEEKREKKYEYSVVLSGFVSNMHDEDYPSTSGNIPIVRREVGEWEEVDGE